MIAPALDARFTFDAFVVGPGTRLAAAAARRVAEAPGSAYNPLFLYSGSGLGKTHLVMALGQHATKVGSGLVVVYDTLEHLMEQITAALAAGEQDAFRHRLRDADLLILDDVQFLAGRRAAQEELLRAWDAFRLGGGQVVLASDRPPTEIDDLDERLLSRFAGGLIVDLAAPDYETRIAIVKRKAGERGHALAAGVAETLARVPFANVRALQGGLNRVLAIQELDGRAVDADEVGQLFGRPAVTAAPAALDDEFGSFLAEMTGAVAKAIVEPATAEQRLGAAIARWQRAGLITRRLDAALAQGVTVEEADALLNEFTAAADRLEAVAAKIRALDGEAPELAKAAVLRDPDRLDEAEALLDQVRERGRGLPPPPAVTFEMLALDASLFALRAARAIAAQPGGAYNPFYVHGPAGSGRSRLLAAIGNAAAAGLGPAAVGFLSASSFSADLVAAIERNRVDQWRARFRRARMLIIDDLDELAGTERAQEELFHLFDDLRRAGAQLVFSGVKPPREVAGLEERLRTRLESGLVVELAAAAGGATAAAATGTAGAAALRSGGGDTAPAPRAAGGGRTPPTAAGAAAIAHAGPAEDAAAPAGAAVASRRKAARFEVEPAAAQRRANGSADPVDAAGSGVDEWFLRSGRVMVEWPDDADWLAEELN
jgi:chromosomal replication initiator protein